MKIDSEKQYNHNFYEEINVALSKAEENFKRDSLFSFEEKFKVPSLNEENPPEDKSIYDEKTITEITCPDKVVISENIIKDVCIDEGAKVSPNKIEENGKISSNTIEEGDEIALKTVQDQKPLPNEKEVVIGEISDEKIISLKELFFSEDQKSAELDTEKFDEKKSIVQIQSIEKHSHEATMTIGPETREPVKSRSIDVPSEEIIEGHPTSVFEATMTIGPDAHEPVKSHSLDVPSEEIIEEHPTSISVLSGAETSSTEEMLDSSRSVPSCQAPVEMHAESENGRYFNGPNITSRRSFSKNCEEVNIPGNNSAHIAYSGSLSMRSDSSTTSARSFAFPILQSEWNSSPVKMAKADRRRYRKERGWKSSLFCCGF